MFTVLRFTEKTMEYHNGGGPKKGFATAQEAKDFALARAQRGEVWVVLQPVEALKAEMVFNAA